jgi:hypothetical protein
VAAIHGTTRATAITFKPPCPEGETMEVHINGRGSPQAKLQVVDHGFILRIDDAFNPELWYEVHLTFAELFTALALYHEDVVKTFLR